MSAVSASGLFTPEVRRYAEVAKGFTQFRVGDVLIAKITPCFENGKAAFINRLPFPIGFGSTEFHVVRPSPAIHGPYLYRFVTTQQFRRKGAQRMTGSAGQQRVPSEFLRQLVIPLPPLEEQKRIAAILDNADAIRRKREQAIELADEFLRSLFLDMFGDPVTNPKGWPTYQLCELLSGIESGWSPTCADRHAENSEWGVLKLGAVTSCVFKPEENKALLPGTSPRPKIEVRDGDVLFARKNTYELVAACALAVDPPPRLMMSDLIFRLKISEAQLVLPEYLWQALVQPSLRGRIQKLAGGSAGSMPNISKERLLGAVLPVPPMDQQREFVLRLRKVQSIKNYIAEHHAEAQYASSALAARAFSGGL